MDLVVALCAYGWIMWTGEALWDCVRMAYRTRHRAVIVGAGFGLVVMGSMVVLAVTHTGV